MVATRSGFIAEIRKGSGESVNKGEILIVMDWPGREKEFDVVQQLSQEHESDHAQARTAYLRLVQQQEMGEVVDATHLETYRAALESAGKRLAETRIKLARSVDQQNRQFIRSPGDFRICEVLVQSNQVIARDQPLIELTP